MLVAAIGCAPATINLATETVPDIRPPAAAQLPCNARQPDLSIGSIVYLKGKATLNGSVPGDSPVSLRHGDRIATASDGFVAIELLDGNLVRISPSSTVVAHCNSAASGVPVYAPENAAANAAADAVDTAANDKPYRVTGAHMSGGIRG